MEGGTGNKGQGHPPTDIKTSVFFSLFLFYLYSHTQIYKHIYKYYIYIYTPWPLPPILGGSRQHKQWGFYSVLLAMTRSPAEFGWHCWSNTAHPPQSSTTYVTSPMPFPLLPLTHGCLYKTTMWQQKMPIRTASQSFATHSYSLHAHLPPSYPSSYHSGLSLLHPYTQT